MKDSEEKKDDKEFEKSHAHQMRTGTSALHTENHFLDTQKEIDKRKQKLPHWQQGDCWVFVTWRLGDSLPQSKIQKWKKEKQRWLEKYPKPWDEEVTRKYYQQFDETVEAWLDQGMGSCCLAQKQNAKIVADSLLYFHGERYELSDFVVMPNHVHVLFRPLNGWKMSDILQTWKSFTSRKINEVLNTKGRVWQENYWDRLIRGREHFEWVKKYIHENPRDLKCGSFLIWSVGVPAHNNLRNKHQ